MDFLTNLGRQLLGGAAAAGVFAVGAPYAALANAETGAGRIPEALAGVVRRGVRRMAAKRRFADMAMPREVGSLALAKLTIESPKDLATLLEEPVIRSEVRYLNDGKGLGRLIRLASPTLRALETLIAEVGAEIGERRWAAGITVPAPTVADLLRQRDAPATLHRLGGGDRPLYVRSGAPVLVCGGGLQCSSELEWGVHDLPGGRPALFVESTLKFHEPGEMPEFVPLFSAVIRFSMEAYGSRIQWTTSSWSSVVIEQRIEMAGDGERLEFDRWRYLLLLCSLWHLYHLRSDPLLQGTVVQVPHPGPTRGFLPDLQTIKPGVDGFSYTAVWGYLTDVLRDLVREAIESRAGHRHLVNWQNTVFENYRNAAGIESRIRPYEGRPATLEEIIAHRRRMDG